MKFAKELQDELVAEWQAKYFNYKQGKKKVKAIARALRTLENTSGALQKFPFPNRTPSSNQNEDLNPSGSDEAPIPSRLRASTPLDGTRPVQGPVGPTLADTNLSRLPIGVPERTPLCSPRPGNRPSGSYGSIIASPPEESNMPIASLRLPDPALTPDTSETAADQVSPRSQVGREDTEQEANGRHGGDEGAGTHALARSRSWWTPNLRGSQPLSRQTSMRRPTFTLPWTFNGGERGQSNEDVAFGAYHELESRQVDFVSFLDSELKKIEEFYKQKEQEASEKLHSLRDQLHLLRDMRIEELRRKKSDQVHGRTDGNEDQQAFDKKDQPLWKRTLPPKLASRSRQLKHQPSFISNTPEHPRPGDATIRDTHQREERRDFARKVDQEISYRTAKRRLKMAIIEYYRGLELLKSYVELNHKAFRKINKKYDKVTNARPTLRYLNENVNKAWFVQSEVVDAHMATTEDLYSRYFERGNRKIAVRKLKGKASRVQDYTPSTFRNGFMLAGGIVLAIQGLVCAGKDLFHDDPVVHERTSYLLQIYGGYLMVLLHFLIFVIDCRVWVHSKINYVFVFEYDTRNVLDWRQLAELPCFFALLFGLIFFLNFQWVNISVFIYWPVILIGLTVFIIFMPLPILYPRARRWWAYSNWRLLLPGLYPVEFRDFFLGDMYCSHTYAMGNIALFFCLYGHHWSNAPQCNSNHSRAMGFMTTVPAIIRALQCLRRYTDTKNVFPHLVNMGKYTFTLLFYMSLSLYRIRRVTGLRALFVVFGSIYAIYSIIWDLAMDWSLCNPYSKNKFLRDSLAFRRKWVYYAAMVADVILRCTWIFYAIFSHDFQHSGLLSFFVSFAEVMRRGLWVIFRVENEHCTNVELFRASRDIPLPYHIPPTETSTPEPEEQRRQQQTQEGFRRTSGQFPQFASLDQQGEIRDRPATAEERPPMPPSGLGPDLERDLARFKRGQQSSISRMGTMLARAHTQDFERRTPAAETPSGHMGHNGDMSSSEEEEEEEGTVSNGSRNGTDRGSNEGSSSNSLLQRRHRRGSRDGESTHTQDDTESQSSQPSPKTRARQKGYDDDTTRR